MNMNFFRRRWFAASAGLLLVILMLNVWRHQKAMVGWGKGLFRRDVLVDVARWQTWADVNAGFFGPLAPGVCVALVRDPTDYAAAVLIKTSPSVRVEKSKFLTRRGCSVYFAMDAATADKILSLRADQGNLFWDTWKQLARSDVLRVYTFGSPDELQAKGVMAFLRSIDVRPVQHRY